MIQIASKYRISVTIMPEINDLLDFIVSKEKKSKSSIVEMALRIFLEERLEKDAKALSEIKFDDLPTEDDWLLIQAK